MEVMIPILMVLGVSGAIVSAVGLWRTPVVVLPPIRPHTHNDDGADEDRLIREEDLRRDILDYILRNRELLSIQEEDEREHTLEGLYAQLGARFYLDVGTRAAVSRKKVFIVAEGTEHNEWLIARKVEEQISEQQPKASQEDFQRHVKVVTYQGRAIDDLEKRIRRIEERLSTETDIREEQSAPLPSSTVVH